MRPSVLLVLSTALVACSSEAPLHTKAAALAGPLDARLTELAARHAVPRDLLVAIAVVEECLDIPARRVVEPDAHVPLAGPLCLRHGKRNTLAEGAALVGATELALQADADLALDAGVQVVAKIAREQGVAGDPELPRWAGVVAELGGFADERHRTWYVHQVYATLQKGGAFAARAGEQVSLAPHVVPAALTETVDLVAPDPSTLGETMGVDYPGAEWFPTSCSGKCDATRGGNAVQYVVVHDTEGGWAGSVATLQNDPGKSVHYIVGTDGRVGQFVNETVCAWHAGNYPYNQRSIGIEHVGYWNKSQYTEVEYQKSAELAAYLTKKFGVAKDRAHIIGHDQIPASGSGAPCSASPKDCEASSSWGGAGHHTDPGIWEWCTYMARFGGTCKCNDIWPLWNCSFDKKKAFRCNAGAIEIDTCDGAGACEVMPLGTADVCHKGAVLPTDAGPETSVVDAGDAGVDSGPADTGAPDTGAPVEAALEGGCSCRTERSSTHTGAIAFIGIAGAIFLRRRRS